MEKPVITCYVLSYKNFDNIYSTIQSIFDQNYPNIEFGIFDDGSDNFPKNEIEEYIECHKRENIKKVIVWSNKKNLGTVRNLNNMLNMTSGKYLIGIGADDEFYDRNVCSKLVDYFEKTNADIVTSYKEVVDCHGNFINKMPHTRSARRIAESKSWKQFKMIAMGTPVSGAGTYYSRKIIEKYGRFDEKYKLQEDGPFLLRATRNGDKIYLYDGVTLRYMLGNGVSSGKDNNPILVNDVINMFENEVVPFEKDFSVIERRRIWYAQERIKSKKKLEIKEKIYFCLKYPDVMLYRIWCAR